MESLARRPPSAKAIQRNNCYDFDGCRGLIV
jgi:hypothetical protein